MEQFVLKAEPRTQLGSRAATHIRGAGRVPANVYGHKEANIHVTLDTKEFSRFLDAGHRIVTLQIGEKEEPSVIKEVQYDAFGSTIIHVDFTRIRRDEKIQVEVPIETIGIPRGVTGGGVIVFPLKEILVSGFPQDIPEHYEIKIESLEIGSAIRLKDLTPPPQCELVGDPEQVIITIVHQKAEVPVAPAEAAAVQPEVIGKKKEEGEAEPEAEGKKKEK